MVLIYKLVPFFCSNAKILENKGKNFKKSVDKTHQPLYNRQACKISVEVGCGYNH